MGTLPVCRRFDPIRKEAGHSGRGRAGRPDGLPRGAILSNHKRRRSEPEVVPAMHARVTVTLKTGVLDPQGKAIEGALHGLGFTGIGSVRQGKVFDITLSATDRDSAERELRGACEKLLANLVIEDFAIEITDRAA